MGFFGKKKIEYLSSEQIEKLADAWVLFVVEKNQNKEVIANNPILMNLQQKHGKISSQREKLQSIYDELRHGFLKAVVEANPDIKKLENLNSVIEIEAVEAAKRLSMEQRFKSEIRNFGVDTPGGKQSVNYKI